MADDTTSYSPSGWAIAFGIGTFVFMGTTVLSTFMWNKERKKNTATNTGTQAAANAAANAAGGGTPPASPAPGVPNAQPNTTQQTRG